MKKVKIEVTVYFPEDVKYAVVYPGAEIVGFVTKPYIESSNVEYIGCDEPSGNDAGVCPADMVDLEKTEEEWKPKLYEIIESKTVQIFDAKSYDEFNYRDCYETGDLIGEDGLPLTQEQFVAGLKKHFGVEFE